MRDKLVTFLKKAYTLLCIKKPDPNPDTNSWLYKCRQFFPDPFDDTGNTGSQFSQYKARKKLLFKRMKFGAVVLCFRRVYKCSDHYKKVQK